MSQPFSHPWDVTPAQARAIQLQGRGRVIAEDRLGDVRRVAGIDVGFEQDGAISRAAVAVLDFPELRLVESAVARLPTSFPYVPEHTPVRFVRQHFNYGRGAALYHSIRGARRGERARLEPLKFYADLVAYPLVRAATPRPLRTALLLLLTQVANAAGFVVQTMRRERKGRP